MDFMNLAIEGGRSEWTLRNVISDLELQLTSSFASLSDHLFTKRMIVDDDHAVIQLSSVDFASMDFRNTVDIHSLPLQFRWVTTPDLFFQRNSNYRVAFQEDMFTPRAATIPWI
jgi:hypothetical protein